MRTRTKIRSKMIATYPALERIPLIETDVGVGRVVRIGVDKSDGDAVSVPDLLGGHKPPVYVGLLAHTK